MYVCMYGEFNRDCSSLQDEFRKGPPKSVVVPETIDAASKTDIAKSSCDLSWDWGNLRHYWDQQTFNIAWIIWLSKTNLSIAQKKARVDWLKEMLKKYDRGALKHVYDIVAGDESWIYAYEPESKQQLTVWVFQDEPNLTKVARVFSEKLDMSQSFHYNNSCLRRNQENQSPKTDHFSPRQCDLSHIGSNNCIFEHSKHRFDESSAV